MKPAEMSEPGGPSEFMLAFVVDPAANGPLELWFDQVHFE